MESILDELLSEQQVMDRLSLTKAQVTQLRDDGLPFIRANMRTRLYWDRSVFDFLIKRQHTMEHQVRGPREKVDAS